MSIPNPPTQTTPPTPPQRTDPANFAARGDAFLTWMVTWYNELNHATTGLIKWISDRALGVQTDATNAANSAAAASNSATAAGNSATAAGNSAAVAASSANAQLWVSGTNYAAGVSAIDPADFQAYRRTAAGAGTTRPGLDAANWTLAVSAVRFDIAQTLTAGQKAQALANAGARSATENVQVISTNTTAVASRTYVLTASLTLTLPASPAPGDWVAFSNRSGTLTCVIARNGQNIMGLAEDMTVDSLNAGMTLTFADATRGWVLAP